LIEAHLQSLLDLVAASPIVRASGFTLDKRTPRVGLIRGMPDWSDKEQLLVHLSEIPILILDDVGAEKKTAWTEETLFRLVDTRYNLSLPTMIVANMKPADVGEQRVASRVQDKAICQVVFIKAGDYRSKPEKERNGHTQEVQ
jgi:DNA replication protein DnaC